LTEGARIPKIPTQRDIVIAGSLPLRFACASSVGGNRLLLQSRVSDVGGLRLAPTITSTVQLRHNSSAHGRIGDKGPLSHCGRIVTCGPRSGQRNCVIPENALVSSSCPFFLECIQIHEQCLQAFSPMMEPKDHSSQTTGSWSMVQQTEPLRPRLKGKAHSRGISEPSRRSPLS
jgi:hypothetical protein